MDGWRLLVHACSRYWWLCALGLAAGLAATTSVLYSVTSLAPPALTPRAQVAWEATSTMLVDSTGDPFLRTLRTTGVVQPPRTRLATTNLRKGQQPTLEQVRKPTIVQQRPPHTGALIRNANVLPALVLSDQVRAVRQRLFGALPGTVDARATYAYDRPQRYLTSPVPTVEITAHGSSPLAAARLAEGTAQATVRWAEREQRRAKVPPRQRVVIVELGQPVALDVSDHPLYQLAALTGIVVLLVFVGLAVALERARSRPRPAAGPGTLRAHAA
jgi:hypothetical protein